MSISAESALLDLPALQSMIGKRGIADALLHTLAPLQLVPEQVLRAAPGNPYVLRLPGTGVDLLLQYLPPPTPAALADWALAGLTLHSARSATSNAACPGPWGRVDPASFDVAQARTLLGAGLLVMGPMATVEVPGTAGVAWTLLFSFHGSGPLETMAMLAADAYRPF